MLTSLEIRGYRRFDHFRMDDLGRVNLLVGRNSSGKTSVLEALFLLCRDGHRDTLAFICDARNETSVQVDDSRKELRLDVLHLAHGHVVPGSESFGVSGTRDAGEDVGVTVFFREHAVGDHIDGERNGAGVDSVEVLMSWMPGHVNVAHRGPAEWLVERKGVLFYSEARVLSGDNVRMVSTCGSSTDSVASELSDVLLTEQEDLVLDALRIVEPTVERIAIAKDGQVFVNCTGQPPRTPIRSLGDGIYRLLGLALSLVAARDGYLLVDEIDTGLHHTVMHKMWKMIAEASRELNVQVFATTHSRDCVEALATIAHETVSEHSEVMIHRIESDRDHSVAYSEAEILAAAEAGIEVR